MKLLIGDGRLMDNIYIKKVVEAINDDSLVLFVGAGISINSNLPSWNELINLLKDELHLDPELKIDNKDVAQRYYETFGKNDYLKKINSIFGKNGVVSTNPLHELIRKIEPKHIITTNYDTLLEETFEQSLRKYTVISKNQDIPYSNDSHYLIKMHGDLNNGNFVLKQSDYDHYQDNFKMVANLVQSIIMNNTVLFVGYSLQDETLLDIFEIIQDQFSDDAKRAYLYNPESTSNNTIPSKIQNGIKIISNSNVNESNKDLYKLTFDFLNDLVNQKYDRFNVRNGDDVWNNLRFLQKLNYIDIYTISKYLGVRKVIDFKSICIPHVSNKKAELINSKTVELLSRKTTIDNILGVSIKHKKQNNGSSELLSAFELYKNKQYSLSRENFRKLANKAFNNHDYYTYLICEFNVKSIPINRYEGNNELESPMVNIHDLVDVCDKLIPSLSIDDRQLVTYLRDYILNYSFMDKYYSRIGKYYHKIRSEYSLVHNRAGVSINNNLAQLFDDVNNYLQFIDNNGLCVQHFDNYKRTIDMYNEAIIMSYRNGCDPKASYWPEKTSSVIDSINLEMMKIMLSAINYRSMEFYVKQYGVGEINADKEAINYLISRIKNYDPENNLISLFVNSDFRDLIQTSQLFNLDSKDVEKIIEVLSKLPLDNYRLQESINVILNIVIKHVDQLTEGAKTLFISIVKAIFDNKEFDYKDIPNFNKYRYIVDKCLNPGSSVIFKVLKLDDEIIPICKSSVKRSKEIFDYSDLIINFYDYFSQETKNEIIEIYKLYESSSDIIDQNIVEEISRILRAGIYDFNQLRDNIYTTLIKNINDNSEFGEGMTFLNDNKSLRILYDLWKRQVNGFSNVTLITNEISKEVKGKVAEVDWDWFGIRNVETLSNLIKSQGINTVIKHFIKTDEDKDLLIDYYTMNS